MMSNRRPLGVRLPPRILLVSYRFNPIDPMDGAVRHRPCAPIGALWIPNGPLFVLNGYLKEKFRSDGTH